MGKKKFTNLVLIDASGSMSRKVDAVRDNIKEILSDIRGQMKENKNMVFRTIICLFEGSTFEVLLDSTKRKELSDVIADKYYVGGMTPLFDAMGKSFNMIKSKQDGVFVNIITDGLENSSREYNQEAITKLISDSKDKGWLITFMGTTEDAIKAAVSWGVSSGNTHMYANNSVGTRSSNRVANSARATYTESMSRGIALSAATMSNFMAEAEESVKKEDKKKRVNESISSN